MGVPENTTDSAVPPTWQFRLSPWSLEATSASTLGTVSRLQEDSFNRVYNARLQYETQVRSTLLRTPLSFDTTHATDLDGGLHPHCTLLQKVSDTVIYGLEVLPTGEKDMLLPTGMRPWRPRFPQNSTYGALESASVLYT